MVRPVPTWDVSALIPPCHPRRLMRPRRAVEQVLLPCTCSTARLLPAVVQRSCPKDRIVTSRHRVPTRNVSSRLLHRLAISLAVGVVGVGSAIAAPAAVDAVFGASGPEPIKDVPANDAATGMIYTGLSPAKRGDPCVGAYRVTERGQCSHGPDAPPPGLFVDQRTSPVAATASVPA